MSRRRLVINRKRKILKITSWWNLGNKAAYAWFYGRLLVETKLITRRGCGGSVSTPSAGEGRLFIKSHVSRVPRRPINSPWRFLLWPWTNLIHISCRSPPPSACFRRNIRNIPRTRILWRSWSFTRRNDASRARVRRRNEFSSKARWKYNDSDISLLWAIFQSGMYLDRE